MKKLTNSIYVTSQGSYLHKERDTIVLEVDKKKVAQIPIHSIGQIFCFGNVLISPFLVGFCGEKNVLLCLYTEHGRFLGRYVGKQNGNVLLRKNQYRMADNCPLPIAKNIIAAKIQSSKRVLQRFIRNHTNNSEIESTIGSLTFILNNIKNITSKQSLLGLEGDAASRYFSVFDTLILKPSIFRFNGRFKRPPTDPVNAILSFLYSVLSNDITSALQGVGLDPQVGFLHSDRSGRSSLSLDILEELRAWLVDRLVLTMINLKQIDINGFEVELSGAIRMKDDLRKKILSIYQSKKQELIIHPYINEKIPIGLIPHIQSQLLARHIRGELQEYPPFLMR
ncbi:type I-C CRISPR-associated endonuclease Cas1c [Taylorella equigenitalis]|uniref:type I-C CRISPR-associated endonuclease Cas1c n=1 Tax=Taylorella equigenitalis TaxID=29575 RepID=UPI000DDA67EA|nr:type I-C CRISPR-associated endonuclease Cas1c [Taylorella equigenitalis]RBA27225.1 subtype I-C CRISPR-associated endonuclease Cas1 [Taylorella equigenitalis]